VRAVFAQLRDGLVPLVAAIAATREAGLAPAPLEGPFPAEAQRRLVRAVLVKAGFDPEHFRLDESTHPFSSGTSRGDQRITVRFGEDSLESLFAGLHEFGHGLYEAQVDAALARTPLCAGVSLSLHESQSRLWENMVGRSRPFCSFVLPQLAEAFPKQFGEFDAAELYRRVNAVRPSLKRVQADEVTYALHIILRFELEVELFEGTLEPEQLPREWRERMRSYLGVEVPDDASGVLQDIHWSIGVFGYFPTYALGNLVAAQLWARIREDLPALDERIAAGDFAPLRKWLADHLHRYGRMFTPAQTLRRATGADLDPQPFLDYLWAKHADVHGARRG
jgi:carboxypeptidase Taq